MTGRLGPRTAGFALRRSHTLQDQAWIETPFGRLKDGWPHLEKIRDSGELDPEFDRVQVEYNTVRTPRSATSPPTTRTRAGATRSAGPAVDGLDAAREARITYRRSTNPDEYQ